MGYIKFKYSCYLLLVLTIISCNNASDEVLVATPFEGGNNYDLSIVRKKNDARSALYTETSVEFITKKNVNGKLTGVWSYGPTEVVGDQFEALGEMEQKIINIYEGLVFHIVVDGEAIELENFNEIRVNLEQLFIEVYGNDTMSTNSQLYGRIRKMFENKANDTESMLSNFFPEISLLFNTFGKTYSNEDVISMDSIKSPYGEGFISIISEIAVSGVSDGYKVVREDSIPQDVLEAQMRNYMLEIFGEDSKDIPFDQMPKSNYSAIYQMDLSKDMELMKLEQTKNLSSAGNDLSTTIIIEVQED